MSIDRGMDQEDVEYRSVIEKNDIMPFAATWMDLEIIKLSEASKREEEKYHGHHLYMESDKRYM